MKLLFISLMLSITLFARTITQNDVYAQTMIMTDEVHFLLKYYGIKHHHDEIVKRVKIDTKLKSRNAWQKTYEVMVKINLFRAKHNLPMMTPVNMAPVLHINPELVYDQNQRILTEFQIFKMRKGIHSPLFKLQSFKNKTSVDVFNSLSHLSAAMDELNGGFDPSYVFGANMRVYDDITLILRYLNIEDKTIPDEKDLNATPANSFKEGMKTLQKIKQLQIAAGIDFVDFSEFNKENPTPSNVFGITQMILAELQTIKAYIGLTAVTPAANIYKDKTPTEVYQLMSWNLRKLNLIHFLDKGSENE